MSEHLLKNATAVQLAVFGDAALRLGQADVALELYRAAAGRLKAVPLSLQSRIGLALAPNEKTLAGLEALVALEKSTPQTVFVGQGLATWMKAPPFAQDPRFMELVERHAHLLPIPNWHWNLSTAVWAAEQARTVDGDFVELGVFRGHTTLFVADYLGFQAWPKTWFLYDTFEGVPADQVDPGWGDVNRAYGDYSEAEVRERFAGFPNIRIVPGRVPEVLAETCPERISFLHLDLNNVTAEIQALEVLWDRVSVGGVLLFDDFGWQIANAQQRAEVAWFAERGLPILALPTGQGLLVKR